MASEAQRIMNLSLTKIVSSKGRRGGVSLHRNLLVASVLFKARDVYAAEMAGLVVIRNGSVYDRNSVPDTPPEAPDQSDDNIIPDQRIQETVNTVVVDPALVHNLEESVDCDDVDLDREKENIKPMDSNTMPTDHVPTKRSRKSQCKKRKYAEPEQPDSGISTKKSRIEEDNARFDCSELSMTLSEWSSDETSLTDSQLNSDLSKVHHNSDTSVDTYSSRSYDDYNDDDDDDDESKYNDVGSYQSPCLVDSCNSVASDSIGFSLSHSVLVVSV